MSVEKKFYPVEEFKTYYDLSEKGWSMPFFHYHDSYEIYFLEHGSRTLYVNNSVYNTADGDVYLLKPYMLHRSDGDTAFNGLCLHFSETYLDKFFTPHAKLILIGCFRNTVISLPSDRRTDLKRLMECAADKPDNLFIHLPPILNLLNDCSPKSEFNGRIIMHDKLPAVMDYVNTNFSSIKSIDTVAKKFYISKNYLGSLFKQQTGLTFVEYINKLKIQYACYRLAMFDYSVEHIALECGFETAAYFGRVFRKSMGCSPTEFRRSAIGKIPQNYRINHE